MISVIIPTYNEAEVITSCLQSLQNQTIKDQEIIVVDDGSTDETVSKVKSQKSKVKNLKLIEQRHQGPGMARNLAAKKARGDILVFVDADMTFDQDFIERVIAPIKSGKAIGTDSQSGVLANPENYWARCWNMGKFAAAGNYTNDYMTEITPNKKKFGAVFRAISKKEFLRVGGFDTDGDYTDDVSLGKKLGVKAKMVDAMFYHANPDTAKEVWIRASWIGSGKNFVGSLKLRLVNIGKFSFPASIIKGAIIGWRFGYLSFLVFKVFFDLAIWLAVVKSFL